MNNPIATYRLQFHEKFTFNDLQQQLPYLQQLGIGTIYASPVFAAVPGSMHGYDNTDPNRINPQIGTYEQLMQISRQIKAAGISWLQDIVPNHMAYHQDNKWLMDVLEKGQDSAYANFFDILWNSSVYNGRLMVPFLGAPLHEVIDKEELKISKHGEKTVIAYFDNYYPLNNRTVTVLQNEPGINNNKEKITEIAESQYYRLCHWQETDKQINYRRFFIINSLICLNIQHRNVFEACTRCVKELLNDGILQGLRIDHIDGLYEPAEYLKELRVMAGMDTYIVVEKILKTGEALPAWPVQGTTGYDFLGMVNNLFTCKSSEEMLTSYYHNLVQKDDSIQKRIHDKKALILSQYMGGELENLYQLFSGLHIAGQENVPSDILKETLGEFLVQCPVYRYYGTTLPLCDNEANAIRNIINHIKKENKNLNAAADLLEQALLVKSLDNDRAYNQMAAHFYKRCMQFTGPLMAKGVEDTLMYTYNRFIGHNEVGDSPESFGVTTAAFHAWMQDRQQRWPMSMNATATHDTKRGEDVRARLNVLTNIPDTWIKKVEDWRKLNHHLKYKNAPDANDEYFIYQTLAGTYPMTGIADDTYCSRIEEYLIKALREAKRHDAWEDPNETYENAVTSFLKNLLNRNNDFLKDFENFITQIITPGIINSLSQLLLKFTCPGIPDTYQGCELWDLSLVDPDNRRPVDYMLCAQWLKEISDEHQHTLQQLWRDKKSGKIKLWLTRKLMHIRKAYADFFVRADYIPLQPGGTYRDNILAFARRLHDEWIITAIPLHIAGINADAIADWKDTHIILPENAPANWSNLLEAGSGKHDGKIHLKDFFKDTVVGLLKIDY